MNPKDPRYGRFVGGTAVVPLVGREVPIIADEHVDIGFGTGALKITPGHDPDDWEIGLRHGLPSISVIGLDGVMTAEAGEFAGQTSTEARAAVLARLEEEGLFVKADDYDHSVGTCYRCGTVIEPLLSLQWFMDMKRLVQPAIKVVEDGRVRFTPRALGRGLPRLDDGHPALVHQPPALVGAPHPGLRLRAVRAPDGGGRAAAGLRQVRRDRPARRGRAGHLVQLGPVAVRHAGLAGGDGEARGLLSHLGALHGTGHHLPVGGPHDHDGHGVPGRHALSATSSSIPPCWRPTAGA